LKIGKNGNNALRISLRYQKEEERGVYIDITPVNRTSGFDVVSDNTMTFCVKRLNRRSERTRVLIFSTIEFLADGIALLYSQGDKEEQIKSYVISNVESNLKNVR
jgi:hypothetical protein